MPSPGPSCPVKACTPSSAPPSDPDGDEGKVSSSEDEPRPELPGHGSDSHPMGSESRGTTIKPTGSESRASSSKRTYSSRCSSVKNTGSGPSVNPTASQFWGRSFAPTGTESRGPSFRQAMSTAVDAMEDARAMLARQGTVAQGIARDFWQPLPESLSAVLETFKNIKQSVVEVIRVTGVEVHIPPDFPPDTFFVEVRIESPERKCCRRRHQRLYGSCVLPLQNNGRGVLRSAPTKYDCRVLALHRRRGAVQVNVQLLGSSRKSVRKTGGGRAVLSRYTAAVPYVSGPDMLVSTTAAEYLSHMSHTWKLTHQSNRLDQSSVQISLKAIKSNQVFDIERCRPTRIKYVGHDEWRPSTARQWSHVWKSNWRDENVVNWSGLLHTMASDMKSSAIILYHTLFAQSLKNAPWRPLLSGAEEEAHDLRVLFLKRLILLLAACKLTFCTEENGTFLRAWPFPLASALAHGNRILVRLDGVPWQHFVNLLLFGDPKRHHWGSEDAVPSPFWTRWAATHAIGLHPETCRLYERRLNTGSVVKNVTDGLLGHHLGMDLPIGGLGNRAPASKTGPLFVGPAGVPFRKLSHNMDEKPDYAEEVQNGHLYLRWDDFGVTTVPVLQAEQPNARHNGKRRKSFRFYTAPVLGHLEVPKPPSTASAPLERTRTPESPRGNALTPPAPSLGTTKSVLSNEDWVQLPAFRRIEDLQSVLREHGHEELAENRGGALERLYKLLEADGELALQSSGLGRLRLQGVLIHLVLVHAFDGEEKVLVHRGARAEAVAEPRGQEEPEEQRGGPKAKAQVIRDSLTRISQVARFSRQLSQDKSEEAAPEAPQAAETQQVEDLRVAVELRRRHEPWTEAMRRLCQEQLRLTPAAEESLLKSCRRAMSGEAYEAGGEEMYVYLCAGPPSLCHHHRPVAASGLPIQYQAYQFSVQLQKKHKSLFQSVCHSAFESVEEQRNLDDFGGGLRGRSGSITRSWGWMSLARAHESNVGGLRPPEERLHVVHETAPLSAVMIGIESSAPHKESFFGGKHGVSGASKDVSAFGARKWRDYRQGGQEVPADVGGMRVQLDQQAFEDLVALIGDAPLSRPSDGYDPEGGFERKLFRALLVASDEEAEQILREQLGFERPTMLEKTGTRVLDVDVRERSGSIDARSSRSFNSDQPARKNSFKSVGSRPAALDDSEDEVSPAESERDDHLVDVEVEAPGEADGAQELICI